MGPTEKEIELLDRVAIAIVGSHKDPRDAFENVVRNAYSKAERFLELRQIELARMHDEDMRRAYPIDSKFSGVGKL